MFQINNRVSSITLNDNERLIINERIQAFQEKKGIIYSSVKELFSALLSDALSSENNLVDPLPPNPIPENNTNTTEVENELNQKIQALTHENSVLSLQVDDLSEQVAKLESIEIDEPEPFKPADTDVYIPLDEAQYTALKSIANNRHSKGKDTTLLSISEIGKKMIFNQGALYNWGGEFYTGYKKEKSQK